ncbi:ATP-binding protein [Aliirhizobium terrae]|uniref:sensor histidine kinase n=1 Tax=Terrirhizobium terrae TaxID=2926709 RepID=UPI002574B1AC|nr:ATP-binding protein [Rhizobium sp. CC-CFT758]WJH41497.1 ATP-binding protein [Rhizobium sp. CC-CFT758]
MTGFRLHLHRSGTAWETLGVLAAATIAVCIFLVDALTSINGAIAGLYVVPMLLLAEILTRTGIIAAASTFAVAGFVALLVSHGTDIDFPTILRLSVSLAAIAITAALLLRNHDAKQQLITSNASLRQSEARYRSIFDNTSVALWERDYSGLNAHLKSLKANGITDIREYALSNPGFVQRCLKLIGTNSANSAALELLGPSCGKSKAGSFDRFFLPDDDTFIFAIEALFHEQSYLEMEATMVSDGGERRRVLLSMSVPEENANYDRVVVSMTDLTHRIEAKKALDEAKADLTLASRAATVGALTASLAHELNQPLGAIVVNSKTLMRWLDKDPPDLASAYKTAERMERDSRRASEIIRNTREHLTKSARFHELTDLHDLLRETLVILEQDLERQHISIKVTSAPGLPQVHIVRIEIQQVLINLITNALQAVEHVANARIAISLGIARAGEVYVAIRDNGPGLPENVLNKLAKPFFTTKIAGMGLGLSICQSLLEAHGGTLHAMNNAEGGACFEMTLKVGPDNG